MSSFTTGLSLALLVALSPRPAAAATCEERAAWIQGRLEREAHRVSVWRQVWGWGAAGATVAQLVVAAAVDDRDTRIDFLVGAGSTLPVFVGVLLPPEIDAIPDPRAADCPARLADAELRLAAAADNERAARSPWLHAANAVFNVGVGLLLGLGFDHWASGVISAVAGFAVGEVQLLTVPDAARDDLAQTLALAPLAAPRAVGVALVVRF